MKLKLTCFIVLSFLFLATLSAQKSWLEYDNDIRLGKNFVFLANKIEQIKINALDKQEYFLAGRCYDALIKIKDKKTEDTLYFKNSFIIDSILQNANSPIQLQSVMHILQAKRLSSFLDRFFSRTNKNLYRNYTSSIQYNKLTKRELDSLVNMHFENANTISKTLSKINIDDALWLSSDPLVFFFKPTYTDIIYAEQINYFELRKDNFTTTNTYEWLTITPNEFLTEPTKAKGMYGFLEPVHKIFCEWGSYNKANLAAYYFIESLARKYMYKNSNQTEKVKKLYEAYLERQSTSEYSAVKANAVYQLCLYWNIEAVKYNNEGNYAYDSYSNYNVNTNKFNLEYLYHYKKALDLYLQNEQMLDSFSYVKDILYKMRERILFRTLNIETQQSHLPNETIALKVKCKNVKTLFIKIVKLNATEELTGSHESIVKRLQNFPDFFVQEINLPATDDYQLHKVEIDLKGLPIGHYAILYNDTLNLPKEKSKSNYVLINVTKMAVINNDNRFFVLDRKSGYPMKNTTVQIKYKKGSVQSLIPAAPKKVNKQGWVFIKNDDGEKLYVVNESDTLVEDFSIDGQNLPDEIFGKEEDDDLVGYYEDNLKLHMFTDRAIYRPGQTVHYKGIFLIPNPFTGEQVVLNKENLKFSWLKKIFNKEVRTFALKKREIYIDDAFNKTVDTIKAKPNEFGSFSGSYKISKDAPTGEWRFDAEDIGDERIAGFKVEEYKRPQFELTLEKPTNYLQLGDSFMLKAKVKSFAGASLNNVKIKYKVSANGNLPTSDSLLNSNISLNWSNKILDTIGYTNKEGVVEIKVSRNYLRGYTFNYEKNFNVNFYISAEAIDESGESHEENTRVVLSNKPIKINYSIEKIVDKSLLVPLYISTKSAFAGELKKEVEVKLYKINKKNEVESNVLNTEDDYQLENGKWKYIGDVDDKITETPELTIIYTTKINTGGDEKFIFPKELMKSGLYGITVLCKENDKVVGENSIDFSVFDKEANTLPDPTTSFHYIQNNTFATGEKTKWIMGNSDSSIYSIYHAQYFTRNKKITKIKYDYDIKQDKKGINEWSYTIPQNVIDEIELTHIYILDNELHKEVKSIYVRKPVTEEPEIIIEQYRKKLMPGSKETYVISIKTKDENVVAELMTTMYDASLDKIEKHEWNLPRNDVRFNISNDWTIGINLVVGIYRQQSELFVYGEKIKKNGALFWLNPLDYAYSELKIKSGLSFDEDGEPVGGYLQGKVSGLNITSTEGLQEVVVTGYGLQKQSRSMAFSSVVIRGATSLTSLNAPMIILDGVIYNGDLSKLNPSSITQGIILKGADATALYGSEAANGVLILSTKGPIILPKPEEAPIVVRKNFSETAFFYPNIYADAEGFYNIEFTMPESVTEWKWKLLAHTKKAKFISAERNIVTQLPMMVQPNMPRFLYQGDRIVLQIRITNLDTTNLEGNINCRIEDAVTGEDLTANIITKKQQVFSVLQKSNSNVAYEFAIPENLLHPLKIKITARAGSFSDGEEHTIPILSKKILVSQNVAFVLTNTKDSSINTPLMPIDAVPYAMGMYITPKPQAAMMNALPYLAFYKYNCAEQTFNKLLAHSIANNILRTDSIAQKTMQAAKAKEVANTKINAVPDELSEETMPWLQLGNATMLHQKNLLKLFDTLNGNMQIEKYISDIKDLQNTDGGITWFKGGRSSKYISNYILAGFAKLQKQNLLFFKSNENKIKFETLIPSLVNFCDASFIDTINYRGDDLNYIYARSFWVKNYPIPSINIARIDEVLKRYWLHIDNYSLNNQALVIMSSLMYAEKTSTFYKNAVAQLESIRQLAIDDNVNGIRWKDIADTDDLNSNNEETVTHLAEVFEGMGESKETINGIIKWLLNAKQDHNWTTTKSTADVVGLLYRNQTSVVGLPISLKANINNFDITVTDNLLNGNLFSSVVLQEFPAAVSVKKDNEKLANAGLNYFYFTANPPISTNENALKISKEMLFLNEKNTWEAIKESTVLKIADKVKTIITIDAPKQLKFVSIDEKRAATLEPTESNSGYEYGKGFGYYKSVRDIGYQFFAEQIPSGISTIEYETVVAKEGKFSNGPVALQCMYKLEVKAYGVGSGLIVK